MKFIERGVIIIKEAVVELGSNLLDRKLNIHNAIEALSKLPKTKVLEVSSYYETEPFEVPDKQENYINCCVKIETDLLPETLLGSLLGIEAAMGRVRPFKNAARIIDADLLFYADVKMNTNDLILPHPEILKRAFVLVPLTDLYKDKVTPAFDFSEILDNMDVSGVKKIDLVL